MELQHLREKKRIKANTTSKKEEIGERKKYHSEQNSYIRVGLEKN